MIVVCSYTRSASGFAWDVAVHLESKSAQVQMSQDVPDDVLKTAIEDAGYQLVSIQ